VVNIIDFDTFYYFILASQNRKRGDDSILRVQEGEYGGNIMYTCMSMEK
jgi:hypothetical protein